MTTGQAERFFFTRDPDKLTLGATTLPPGPAPGLTLTDVGAVRLPASAYYRARGESCGVAGP